jgi:cytochrome P450
MINTLQSLAIHTVLAILSVIVFISVYLYIHYRRECLKYKHIPGVELFFPLEVYELLYRYFPFIQWLYSVPMELFSQSNQFVNEVHLYNVKKHGNIYKFVTVYKSYVFVDGDECLELKKMMTLQGHKLTEKTDTLNDRLAQLFGANVFSTNVHDVWKRMRTLLNPAFTDHQIIQNVPQATVQVAHQLINIIDKNPVNRDVSLDLSSVSLDVMGLAGFGVKFNSMKQLGSGDQPDQLVTATNSVLSNLALYYILPFDFMRELRIGSMKEMLGAREFYQGRISELISERRNNPTESKDVLSLLIKGRNEYDHILSTTDEDQSHASLHPLTDLELSANTFLMIVAGHETSARALGFALYCLARNSFIQQKTQELIDTRLPSMKDPTIEDYESLPYIQNILTETLRLYPVAMSIVRQVQKSFTLREYNIPKGTTLICNNHLIYNNPNYFKEPENFDPDRYNDTSNIPRFAISHFGFAQRKCIGQRFAEIEVGIVLIMLLQRYNIRVDPNYQLRLEVAITSRPVEELHITFEKR